MLIRREYLDEPAQHHESRSKRKVSVRYNPARNERLERRVKDIARTDARSSRNESQSDNTSSRDSGGRRSVKTTIRGCSLAFSKCNLTAKTLKRFGWRRPESRRISDSSCLSFF